MPILGRAAYNDILLEMDYVPFIRQVGTVTDSGMIKCRDVRQAL